MVDQPELRHRLYEVVYRSKATTDSADQANILDKARECNARNGLTGVLV